MTRIIGIMVEMYIPMFAGLDICTCTIETHPSGGCQFCTHARYMRMTRRFPVEERSSSHRGYSARRKRARKDPQMIEFWCPDDCGNPSPALARARVHVSANSK